jgi:hypothetical protein
VSIFASVAIVFALDLVAAVALKTAQARAARFLKPALFGAAVALVIYFNVSKAFSYKVGFPTLGEQDEDVREMLALMRPGDRLFVHGQTEILALSGLDNASRHIFLDRGKDRYLDQVEPGGFEGWLAALKEEKPRIVALSRLGAVERKRAFVDWVRGDYEMRKGRFFKYYVRKDDAQ